MKIHKSSPLNFVARPVGGPRTLICTHLPKKANLLQYKVDACVRFWENARPLFSRRLSLCDEYGNLPEGIVETTGVERRIYTESGAIDEAGCPALDEGFAGPGYRLMVLGGGYIDACLAVTFESLVRTKLGQDGEKLQAILPLPIIYCGLDGNTREYINSRENVYIQILREFPGRPNWIITLDGQPVDYQGRENFAVEVHFFMKMSTFLKFLQLP